MTLEDIILGRQELWLKCSRPACRQETIIDAHFFAARHGLNMTLGDLKSRLVCTGCGSSSFSLITRTAQDRRLTIKPTATKGC